ncbi:MAG: DUF58 domain-containing protein [Gallionella sp.]|nr:DUF58 domain-containing protein [Gallionella sp.]MDD4945814.1 DUF58 domain-containing protein [Gallionella sp.]MDD5612354.1 DUF58 domain-containing protein [Gallionella sp.]
MSDALRQKFRNWLFRPTIEHGPVVLTQRRIFILPTRQGLALAALLLLMLLGSINYALSLGYVLTFLLAMMAVMSMLHAFRNLAHLEIRAGRAEPVFCGETANFVLHFASRWPRYQLCLTGEDGTTVTFDLAGTGDHPVRFPLPTRRRGWLQTGRLRLYTEFPLGLFHAWSYLHFDTRLLVYARAMPQAALPPGDAPDGEGKRTIAGDDDFAGLRGYQPGDALPRIAWKAWAGGRGLQVKQFASQSGDELWLNLADATDAELEDKLSRLTRWVLDAEAAGLRYGLRLPDGELPPANGDSHRDECLTRIALSGPVEMKSPAAAGGRR